MGSQKYNNRNIKDKKTVAKTTNTTYLIKGFYVGFLLTWLLRIIIGI